MLRAVILAAGASSRMGRPKASLPLTDGADTFLSRLIRSFLAAQLPEIIVVTGASVDDVIRGATPFGGRVRFVHNPEWRTGQLSSLLAAIDDRSVMPIEGVLMTLVDTPLVTPATVRAVVAEWRRTRAVIVRPVRGDEHGHPVIFDASLFDELRGADRAIGAKAVVRAHAGEILNVPIDDPGAYRDIDTPDDYEQLLRST